MGKIDIIYGIMKQLYSGLLRSLLVKAIDDPDSEVDDFIVSLVDKVFDYSG